MKSSGILKVANLKTYFHTFEGLGKAVDGVEHISDRVAVMYLGKIVEMDRDTDLYTSPKHPYTEALLSAVPVPNPKMKKKRIILEGEIPSPINLPKGCRFYTRCTCRLDICKDDEPEFKDLGGDHWVYCHLY